jgi:hypothetical protein
MKADVHRQVGRLLEIHDSGRLRLASFKLRFPLFTLITGRSWHGLDQRAEGGVDGFWCVEYTGNIRIENDDQPFRVGATRKSIGTRLAVIELIFRTHVNRNDSAGFSG